jgi:catechol 2,3-dioxygenase-like lactoylglutathione lyase family enzyme
MAKIKHIAIASQDPDKTAAFFKDVFDLEEVGRVDSQSASGYYLSDGNVNMAILNFKNEVVAGAEFGTDYAGIHHIGFQVDDAEATEARLKKNESEPRDDINKVLHAGMGRDHGGRNVETKYAGPEGIMIDISQSGWVGTDGD